MTTINGIKRFFTRPARLGLMAAAGLMAGGALAEGYWWVGDDSFGGDGTSWSNAKNWATDSTLGTVAESAPGSSDTVNFTVENSTPTISAATTVASMNVTADTTISGAYSLIVSGAFTGSADKTVTINDGTTLKLYQIDSWDVPLPQFNTSNSGTLHVGFENASSDTSYKSYYFDAPVSGSGTLYLYNRDNRKTVYFSPVGSTFTGTIQLFEQFNDHPFYFGADGGPGDVCFMDRPKLDLAGKSSSNTGYLCLGRYAAIYPLKVRGITGTYVKIQSNTDTAYEGKRYIDVELDNNYTYSGAFSDTADTTYNACLIVGSKSGTAYTQTLSGANTTYGDLIVTNNATVNLTGSWANGPVTVAKNSRLTINAVKSFSSLKMGNVSTLEIPAADATYATIETMTLETDATAIISVADSSAISTLASAGTPLISWTTKPTTGSFIFESGELNRLYTLEIGETGLNVVTKVTPGAEITSYTWNGTGGNNFWSNPLNWNERGVPGATDTAVFNSEASVFLSSATSIFNVTLNADVTLAGNMLSINTSDGTGKWILDQGAGFQNNGEGATISNDIHLSGANTSVTNKFANSGYSWTFSGKLTGRATFYASAGSKNCGIAVLGDWSEFAGHVYVEKENDTRNNFYLAGDNYGAENATWEVYSSNQSAASAHFLQVMGKEYRFGSLDGAFYQNSSGQYTQTTIVVGKKGLETSLGGYFNSQSDDKYTKNSVTVQLVGGTLHVTARNPRRYLIEDGTLDIADDRAATISPADGDGIHFLGGTLKIDNTKVGLTDETKRDVSRFIKDSTAPIRFDTQGNDYTWATQLVASNTGGLEKLGEGTLTLSYVPAYSGFGITVKAGAVLLPETYYSTCPLYYTKEDENWSGEGTKRLIPYTDAKVVQYGEEEYNSVQGAIDAAEENGATDVSLTLVANVNEPITIPAGMTVTVDSSSFSFACPLNGAGVFKYTSYPSTLPVFGSNWTGTVELNGSTTSTFKLTDFGNANSTVRIGASNFGAKGGIVANSTTAHAVKELNLVGKFYIGGSTDSEKSQISGYFIIPAKLTGSGGIDCRHQGYSNNQQRWLFLSGDVSEFAGSVRQNVNGGNGTDFQTQFISSDDPINSSTRIGWSADTIAIANGVDVVIDTGKTWTARNGFIVDGTMTIKNNAYTIQYGSANATLAGGAGTIIYEYLPTSKYFGTVSESWTGTIKLPELTEPASNTQLAQISTWGKSQSVIELQDIASGSYGYYLPTSVNTTLKISGDVQLQGGGATTVAKLTGSGSLTVGTGAHTITLVEGFSGTLDTSSGGSFTISAINLDSEPVGGQTLVKTTAGCILNDIAATVVNVNNEQIDIKLEFDSENGGLKVKSVASADGETAYGSVAAAINHATSYVTIAESAEEALSLSKPLSIKLADGVTFAATSVSVTDAVSFVLAEGAASATLSIPVGVEFAGLTIGSGIAVKIQGSGVNTGTVLFSYASGSGIPAATTTINTCLGDIHYTVNSDDTTTVTAGKKYWWTNNEDTDADAKKLGNAYWSTSEGGAAGIEIPKVLDTAIFNLANATTGAKMNDLAPCNIIVEKNQFKFRHYSKDTSRSIGSNGETTPITTFTVMKDATATLHMQQNDNETIMLYGKILGEGTICTTFDGNKSGRGVQFNADFSEFKGSVTVAQTYAADKNQIANISAPLSSWSVCMTGNASNNAIFTGDTYSFGSLSAKVNGSSSTKTTTFTLGGLNRDSDITGTWPSSYKPTINWIDSTATFTQAAANTAALNITGGGKAYVTSVPTAINLTGNGGWLVFDSENASVAESTINAIASATGTTIGIEATGAIGSVAVNSDTATALSGKSITKAGSGTITLTGVSGLGAVTVQKDGGSITLPTGSYTKAGDHTSDVDNGNDTHTLSYNASITIGSADWTYLTTYATATTVVATVNGTVADGTTWSLTVNGVASAATAEYVADGTGSGTVTFYSVTGFTMGDTLAYQITATPPESSAVTSERATTVVGEMTSGGWILEDKDNQTSGVWTNNNVEVSLTYDPDDSYRAALSDHLFTPTNASSSAVVAIETTVCFTEVADSEVELSGAQTAVKIDDDGNDGYVFKVYAKTASDGLAEWIAVAGDEAVAVSVESDYAVKVVLNYDSKTCKFWVGDYPLTNATGNATFYLANDATKVSSIEFKGASKLTSLSGSYVGAESISEDVSGTDVKVDSAWVAANMGDMAISEARAALAPNAVKTITHGAQSYNYFECYALGLEVKDDTDVPIINATPDASGAFNMTLEGIKVPEGVKLKVQLQGKSSADAEFNDIEGKTATAIGTAEGTTTSGVINFNPATEMGEDNVKYFKMEVDIGATTPTP